jgi:hypothetical protein
MSWLETTLDKLTEQPVIGYLAGGAVAAEPTAIAALALAAHGRLEGATKAAEALVRMQTAEGAVGVRSGETPGWPTSLAMLAWHTVATAGGPHQDERIARAAGWLLAHRGRAIERSDNFGHNSELVGWAYAEGTHSWAEPTALAVMALAAAGQHEHAATQEGIAVLLDRQLPEGGYNYGNTYVLGQLIRPHVQPTGIVLLALAQVSSDASAIHKSAAWLERHLDARTTPMSLAWALLGLRAQGRQLATADEWLMAARERVAAHDRSPHKLALILLAAKGWPR